MSDGGTSPSTDLGTTATAIGCASNAIRTTDSPKSGSAA